MNTADNTIEFLVGLGSQRKPIEEARKGEAQARDMFESDRAVLEGLSLVARKREELSGLFKRNREYKLALDTTLKSIGRTGDEFHSEMKRDEKITEFVASIPNLDVYVTLRIEREKDKDRKIDRNDIRDLDWLSVAVPYSNVVVSEKYWGNKVLGNGLDTRYGTVLLTNVQDLPTHLSTMGCLD